MVLLDFRSLAYVNAFEFVRYGGLEVVVEPGRRTSAR